MKVKIGCLMRLREIDNQLMLSKHAPTKAAATLINNSLSSCN